MGPSISRKMCAGPLPRARDAILPPGRGHRRCAQRAPEQITINNKRHDFSSRERNLIR